MAKLCMAILPDACKRLNQKKDTIWMSWESSTDEKRRKSLWRRFEQVCR